MDKMERKFALIMFNLQLTLDRLPTTKRASREQNFYEGCLISVVKNLVKQGFL
jgi:hypothetical protein